MKSSFLLLFAISSTAFAGGPAGTFRDFYGPEFHRQPTASSNKNPNVTSDVLHRWNRIAIDATGLDHTPVAPGENRVFGEQLGPGRSSRAMAIVHIAIFDAINAILGGYQSYTGIESVPHPVSIRAAVAQAAHDTLVSLYPSQKASFDQELAADILRVTSDRQKSNGVALGKQIAAAILVSRVGDGAEIPELHLGVD
ncbi:MAG: chloroperoxidase, partial [Verrucomicrobia bacterium]